MRLAILACCLAAACAVDDLDTVDESTTELSGCFEQPTPMANLPAALHVAEPFIRIVGTTTYLYFSDYAGPSELRDLHHAVWIDNVGFFYLGPLRGVNTPSFIEAAPSIDLQSNIYFTNTALPGMIGRGTLATPTDVSRATAIPGMPAAIQSGAFVEGNMDFGVAPNHPFGALSRALWNPPNPLPLTADLWYLQRTGGTVTYDANLTRWFFGALNTANLEYAPEISVDGLAIVFTRFVVASRTTYIMLATRSSVTAPFGPPIALVANTPGSIIEGPTFGPGRIFYHKAFTNGSPSRLYSVALCP